MDWALAGLVMAASHAQRTRLIAEAKAKVARARRARVDEAAEGRVAADVAREELAIQRTTERVITIVRRDGRASRKELWIGLSRAQRDHLDEASERALAAGRIRSDGSGGFVPG